MARQLREKEQNEVAIWSAAFRDLGVMSPKQSRCCSALINARKATSRSSSSTGQMNSSCSSHLIPDHILNHPNLQTQKDRGNGRRPIPSCQVTHDEPTRRIYIFYDESRPAQDAGLLSLHPAARHRRVRRLRLHHVPLRASRTSRTASGSGWPRKRPISSGTPTSSLLGWIEYLRHAARRSDRRRGDEQGHRPADQSRRPFLENRRGHAALARASSTRSWASSVMYFRTRVPRNVTLTYNGLAMARQKAMVNEALFEWVIENLLKNAMDARVRAKATIDVQAVRRRGLYIHRRQRHGQRDSQRKLQTHFRTGLHDQNAGLGAGTLAQQTDHRGLSRRQNIRPRLRNRQRDDDKRSSLKKIYS